MCRYINLAGSAAGKRKLAPASAQFQSIHTMPPLERFRDDNSSLIINGELRKFKSAADFSGLLGTEGRAYFDRTRYISVLDGFDEEPIFFFRPRRFGKSLT